MKWFNYFYLPIGVSLIIIYLCCLIPNNDVPDVEIKLPFDIQIDKVVHFCMYFGLSIASAFNYLRINKGKINKLNLLFYTFAIPIIFGGLIEIVQYYFCEGRSGDWYDLLADSIGSLFALPFINYYKNYLIRKSKSS